MALGGCRSVPQTERSRTRGIGTGWVMSRGSRRASARLGAIASGPDLSLATVTGRSCRQIVEPPIPGSTPTRGRVTTQAGPGRRSARGVISEDAASDPLRLTRSISSSTARLACHRRRSLNTARQGNRRVGRGCRNEAPEGDLQCSPAPPACVTHLASTLPTGGCCLRSDARLLSKVVAQAPDRRRIPAFPVRQWLPEWEDVEFSDSDFRRRPPQHFYLFRMDAAELKALTGVNRRTAKTGQARKQDLAIQRKHDAPRSLEIAEYIRRGFPWSALSQERKDSGDFDDLVKPGWLPTAIVVNVLRAEDTEQGTSVHQHDVINVGDVDDRGISEIILPAGFSGADWTPRGAHPISVIDGQHRLWAFEDSNAAGFELPVVAFVGLDVAWQAYLFYTINIKPKKINSSLAFDLYPLLRKAEWLDRFEGHSVYRETRAQELTEALWAYPESPWFRRINMVGETGVRQVTQASWIRSLMATFVKSSGGKGVTIGGLYGAPAGSDRLSVEWNRAQQAALLIYAWQMLADAVGKVEDEWAKRLREVAGEADHDPAMAGRFTLLNTDQGVRGYLSVLNDLCMVESERLKLADWRSDDFSDVLSESAISSAMVSLKEQVVVARFVRWIATTLSHFDWRTSGVPGLDEDLRREKARFRGGTGYKEIRTDLLNDLIKSSNAAVARAAAAVAQAVGA